MGEVICKDTTLKHKARELGNGWTLALPHSLVNTSRMGEQLVSRSLLYDNVHLNSHLKNPQFEI